MENYKRLVAELGDGVKPPAIASALSISKVYAWQLENGKRLAIDSKAARKMERKIGKPDGWMDNDPDFWPFQTISWDKVAALGERKTGSLEAAIIMQAEKLKLDIVSGELPIAQLKIAGMRR